MLEDTETGFFVISCSGALKLGQAANAIAVQMDENGFAKMICLAGVGAGVGECVDSASNVRDLIVIDGCNKKCACKILAKAGIAPVHEFCLTELGVVDSGGPVEPQNIDMLRKKIKLLYGQNRSEGKYSVCGCETCVREGL